MGLPDNAETVLLTAKGRDLIRKVLLGMTKEQESAKVRHQLMSRDFSSHSEIIRHSSTGNKLQALFYFCECTVN